MYISAIQQRTKTRQQNHSSASLKSTYVTRRRATEICPSPEKYKYIRMKLSEIRFRHLFLARNLKSSKRNISKARQLRGKSFPPLYIPEKLFQTNTRALSIT